MSKLRGLALSKMQLLSLPQSVHLLSNLQTLCLDQCVLGDISIIGNLEKLENLSLVDSDIEWLPNEIGELTQLRLLDLSSCWNLKVIPPNVISKLTQLEELYMGNTFVKWEFEGKEGGAEASATFVFPKVIFLKLWNLSELRTFYSGLHTSEWPLLKRLEVYGCDKVKIFTSGFFGFRNSVVRQLTIPTQQPLFLVEKVHDLFPFLLKYIYEERDLKNLFLLTLMLSRVVT